jgi:hypothetical protein
LTVRTALFGDEDVGAFDAHTLVERHKRFGPAYCVRTTYTEVRRRTARTDPGGSGESLERRGRRRWPRMNGDVNSRAGKRLG